MKVKESKDYIPHHLTKYDINIRTAMFAVVLSIFIDVLGYSLVLPLLPGIAKTFGASDFLVGIIIASNALTALIAAPVWGRLSDKYGRKPLLMIAQGGTLAAFLLLGSSNSLFMIFFSRLLDGLMGGQMPIIKAFITDITTPQTRTSEIGKITVGASLGMILGPTIGGLLGVIDWRYPAFVASGLSILSIILTWKVILESMPKKRRIDIELKLATIKSNPQNGKAKNFWNKSLILRLIQRLMAFLITVMFNSSLALVIDKRYNGGPEVIGLIMTVGGTAAIFYGGYLMKRVIRRVGEKKVFIFTVSLITIVPFIYPFLYELWSVFIFVIPFAFCMAFMPALIQANIVKAVDPDKQGRVSGWSTNIQSMAQTIAPLIATWYLQIGGIYLGVLHFNSYDLIGYTSSIFGLILIILTYIDFKKNKDLYSHEIRIN
jgi:DHA1 family tetracycline resistance protein-like MFS transporter